jgi:hypothetical protein
VSVARLKAATGEAVEIRFSTSVVATPGGGAVHSTHASDIRVSLDAPLSRPLPDSVLVNLWAEPILGSDHEFDLTLRPATGRSYSGQLDQDLVITTTSFGPVSSLHQSIEFVCVRGGREERLVDPINGTTHFQTNLDQASLAG